jgi:hypothetical protein
MLGANAVADGMDKMGVVHNIARVGITSILVMNDSQPGTFMMGVARGSATRGIVRILAASDGPGISPLGITDGPAGRLT